MLLFHVTSQKTAQRIKQNGFKEHGDGWYGLFDGKTGKSKETYGIFFADSILNSNDGILHEDPVVFIVDIPEAKISQYEWHEEKKGYREWCIPAEIVNKHFTDKKIYTEDEAYTVYDKNK